ncbi:uncharacterized protein JCM6883_002176 [Sporobolomyces salmoneus]|uniref:uncharacterized protein n=1 Tax=Sporobolomyces salmoneus TaxID=183962 RepID=UPI00317A4E85
MGISPRRFLYTLPPHLLCPTCETTLDEGVSVCKARHVFCPPCLEQAGCCSICHETSPNFEPASETIAAVGEQWLRCIDPLCDWVGAQKAEKAHSALCEYRVVLCNLCQTAMRHHELADHLSQVCPEAVTVCEHGGEDCGGQGKGVYYRKDVALHDSICSRFACRLNGCKTRTSLSNLAIHERECFQLRQALFSAAHLLKSQQTAAATHHANASALTAIVCKLPRSTLTSGEQQFFDQAIALYPQAVNHSTNSELRLESGSVLVAQTPITPITPSKPNELNTLESSSFLDSTPNPCTVSQPLDICDLEVAGAGGSAAKRRKVSEEQDEVTATQHASAVYPSKQSTTADAP